jgi:tetratricopeptide (TPR) repeat protein
MIWFNLTFTLMLVTAVIVAVGWAIYHLAPADQEKAAVLAEWPWLVKGLLAPFVLWILMNVGLSFELQPFMPAIQAAQNAGGAWVLLFVRVTAVGLLAIATFWAAVTLVWLILRVYLNLRPELRMEFRAVCFTSFALMGLPAAFIIYLNGWPAIGLATVILFQPIAIYGAPLVRQPKRPPMYSRAVARMKMGKYGDAEKEILQQLEKSENDFDGWLLLAELHATRFHELAEAEKIILDICVHPDATPSQIAVALHKLADWQITLTADPEAAARTLQLICDRLPGTHLARMAENRRRQLPTNRGFQEQREARPIPVPAIPSMFALTELPAPTVSNANLDPALAQIQQLTEALTRDPNSISDREKLARLLAEPLGKVDLAIEQIELLLGMAAQPDVKCAEWLVLIAGWQLQFLQDETTATATLTKLVENYPGTPQAFAAQRRLSLMKAEAAARRGK